MQRGPFASATSPGERRHLAAGAHGDDGTVPTIGIGLGLGIGIGIGAGSYSVCAHGINLPGIPGGNTTLGAAM